MDAKLKADWVAELRSGKYTQGEGKLHNTADGSYCCLGVLCKVMGAEFGPAEEESDDEEFGISSYDFVPYIGERVLADGDAEELKKSVCKDLGIPDQHDLIAMNDGHCPKDGPEIRKHTFPEIADWIEANIPADEPEVSL